LTCSEVPISNSENQIPAQLGCAPDPGTFIRHNSVSEGCRNGLPADVSARSSRASAHLRSGYSLFGCVPVCCFSPVALPQFRVLFFALRAHRGADFPRFVSHHQLVEWIPSMFGPLCGFLPSRKAPCTGYRLRRFNFGCGLRQLTGQQACQAESPCAAREDDEGVVTCSRVLHTSNSIQESNHLIGLDYQIQRRVAKNCCRLPAARFSGISRPCVLLADLRIMGQ